MCCCCCISNFYYFIFPKINYQFSFRKWTSDFADWSKNEAKIKSITDMGFDSKKAKVKREN